MKELLRQQHDRDRELHEDADESRERDLPWPGKRAPTTRATAVRAETQRLVQAKRLAGAKRLPEPKPAVRAKRAAAAPSEEALERKVRETLEERADGEANARFERALGHVDVLHDRAQKLSRGAGEPAAEATTQATTGAATDATSDATIETNAEPRTRERAPKAPNKQRVRQAPSKRAAAKAPRTANKAAPTKSSARGPREQPAHEQPAHEQPAHEQRVLRVPSSPVGDVKRVEMWPSALERLRVAKAKLADTRQKSDAHYEETKQGADPALAQKIDAKLGETRKLRDATSAKDVATEQPHAEVERELAVEIEIKPQQRPLIAAMQDAKAVGETEQQLDRAIADGERYIAVASAKVREELREQSGEHEAETTAERDTETIADEGTEATAEEDAEATEQPELLEDVESQQAESDETEQSERDEAEPLEVHDAEDPEAFVEDDLWERQHYPGGGMKVSAAGTYAAPAITGSAHILDAIGQHAPVPAAGTYAAPAITGSAHILDAIGQHAPVPAAGTYAAPAITGSAHILDAIDQHAPVPAAGTYAAPAITGSAHILDSIDVSATTSPPAAPAITGGAHILDTIDASAPASPHASQYAAPAITDSAHIVDAIDQHAPAPTITGSARILDAIDASAPASRPAAPTITGSARIVDAIDRPRVRPATFAGGAGHLDTSELYESAFDGKAPGKPRHVAPAITGSAKIVDTINHDMLFGAAPAPNTARGANNPRAATTAREDNEDKRRREEERDHEERQRKRDDHTRERAAEDKKVEEAQEQEGRTRRAEADEHIRAIDNHKHPELALIQRDIAHEANEVLSAVSPHALGLGRHRGERPDEVGKRAGIDPAKLRPLIAPSLHEVLPETGKRLRPDLHGGRELDVHGLVDPAQAEQDKKDNAQLPNRLRPLIGDHAAKAGEDYEPLEDVEPAAPQPGRAGGGGGAPAPEEKKTEPPPTLPAELRSGNQAAINAFVEQKRREREAKRKKVKEGEATKCALIPFDAFAVAHQVKAKNDEKLRQIRAKAELDKAKAAADAAAKKQEGPVTLESLKQKLETEVGAEKEKLKQTFDTKKAELKARFDTQRETLTDETRKQTDHIKTQQGERRKEAEAAWAAEQKGLTERNKELVAEIRKTCEADQKKLEDEKKKLGEAADKRMADIESQGKIAAAMAKADGALRASLALSKAHQDAAVQRAIGKTMGSLAYATFIGQKAQEGVDVDSIAVQVSARLEEAKAAAKYDQAAKDCETQGKLDFEKLLDAAEKQKRKVDDETKRAVDDAKKKAYDQVEAIKKKIDGIGPLGEQKIKDAGAALKKNLDLGEANLKQKLQQFESKIESAQQEGEAKIAKLEADAEKKLQTEYDQQLKAIDQRLEQARKALASGNAQNLKALERMVDQTVKTIDANITAAEKRMESHIAAAEKQAQAFMLAQLAKIKAEADKALAEIDRMHELTMKMVDDAIDNAYRTVEESAEGKMLEIEVHVATMYKDIGDDSRYKAVKNQLAWYVENKQPIPQGYGEVVRPEKPAEQEKKEEGATGSIESRKKDEDKKDEKKDGDNKDEKKDGDKKDDKPEEEKKLSKEEIDAEVEKLVKRGQTDTSVGIAAAAEARVWAAHKAAIAANAAVEKERAEHYEKMKAGDPKAREEIESYYKDEENAEKAAEDFKKALEKENWLKQKSPDKQAILKALEGKNKREIEMMREILKEKGIDLDAIIDSELEDKDKQTAKMRLTGNPDMADIGELGLRAGHHPTGNQKLATSILIPGGSLLVEANGDSTIGADQDRIKEILARHSGDMDKFAAEFEQATGQSLAEFLRKNGLADEAKELGVPEVKRESQEELDAQVAELEAKHGPVNTAVAAKSVSDLKEALHGFHLDGTRADSVRAALEGKSPAEIAFIKAKYKEETGQNLDADLESTLTGPALAEAKAHMRNDKTTVMVNKLLGAEDASLTPWTVDDKRMVDTLKELKDPEERRAVLEAYKARTGIDLSEVIADKMTGRDERLATALYEGDELKAKMIELDEATNGGWLDNMHEAIAERTGVDTEGFTRGLVNLAVGGGPNGETTVIGGYEIGNGSFHKVDSEKIFTIFEETKSPADRERIKALYKQQTGRDLDDDMKHKLTGPLSDDSAKLDAYNALMDGRTDDYYAARMEDALDGLNDTKTFHAQLEGKSEWERKRIIDAYNRRHGGNPNAFAEVCEAQLSGLDVEKAHLLATLKDDPETGTVKLPDEFVLKYAQDSVWTKAAKYIDSNTEFLDKYPGLYMVPGLGAAAAEAKAAAYFMRGWGVDSDTIKDVLKDKSKTEIDELIKKYPQLAADLKYVMSGRDAYEVELMLAEGKPQTPEAMIQRALDLYEFDRGAKGAWIPGAEKWQNGLVDLISPSGQSMDAHAAALRDQLAALQSGNLTPEQKRELDYALSAMDASTTNFITAREAAVGAVATAVGAVAGAVATAVTGGAAAPFVAALVSGLSTVAVKATLMGQAYGRNDIGVDLAMTVVQVATAGIGANAQTFLAEVVSGGVQNMIQSFVETAITAQDAHDLLGLLAAASQSGLVGFMSGAAGSAAQKALDDAMEALGKKLFKADVLGADASLTAVFVKGFVSGGGSAVASMMVEALNDPAMLEGNWDAVFANVMRTFAESGVQGGLEGAAETHKARRDAAKAALAEAIDAAKKTKAEGGSVEDQARAYAEVMAEHAMAEVSSPPTEEEPPKTTKEVQDHLDEHPPADPKQVIEGDDAPAIVPQKIIDVGEAAADPHRLAEDGAAKTPKEDPKKQAAKDSDGEIGKKIALDDGPEAKPDAPKNEPALSREQAAALDGALDKLAYKATADAGSCNVTTHSVGEGIATATNGAVLAEVHGVDHKFLKAGGEIIDPTFHQFFEGLPADMEPEIFKGSKEQLVEKIKGMLDASGDEARFDGIPKSELTPEKLDELVDKYWPDHAPNSTGNPDQMYVVHGSKGDKYYYGDYEKLSPEVKAKAEPVTPRAASDDTTKPAHDGDTGKKVSSDNNEASFDDVAAEVGTDTGSEIDAKADSWEPPTPDAQLSPDEAEHHAAIEQRKAEILAADPSLDPREAERHARNEILHDVRDATPGPVAAAAAELDAAVRAGDGDAAVKAIENIKNLAERRALIQDLRAAHGGESLDAILATLPPEQRAQINDHLDSLRADPQQVAHAQSLIDKAAELDAAIQALREGGASDETLEPATKKLRAARQEAIDALCDAYGIDDSQVRQREASSHMGYGVDRGDIAPKQLGGDGMAEAMPSGNVIMRGGGDALFGIDPATGKPRSAAAIAAALGHEVEVHVEQLRDGRYTKPEQGKPDIGTAINEAEAYAYMVREADRYGLSPEEKAWAQKRYEDQLAMLDAHDPAAAERVRNGDFSVDGHDVVDADPATRTPWGGQHAPAADGHGKRIDDALPNYLELVEIEMANLRLDNPNASDDMLRRLASEKVLRDFAAQPTGASGADAMRAIVEGHFAVGDELAVRKLVGQGAPVPDEISKAFKNPSDVYNILRAAAEVATAKGIQGAESKALGEAIVTAVGLGVELAVLAVTKDPAAKELVGKTIDTAKADLKVTIPELMSRVGDVTKALTRGDVGEALRMMAQIGRPPGADLTVPPDPILAALLRDNRVADPAQVYASDGSVDLHTPDRDERARTNEAIAQSERTIAGLETLLRLTSDPDETEKIQTTLDAERAKLAAHEAARAALDAKDAPSDEYDLRALAAAERTATDE